MDLLFYTINENKTIYIGHVMKGEKYELPKLIIEGEMEGYHLKDDKTLG